MNQFKLQFLELTKKYHVNVSSNEIENCKSQEEFYRLTTWKKLITYCFVCNIPLSFDNFTNRCTNHAIRPIHVRR